MLEISTKKFNIETRELEDKKYLLRFTHNSFSDNDTMEKASKALKLYGSMLNNFKNEEMQGITVNELYRMIGDVTKELIFVGCKKYNALMNLEEAGDVIDDFCDAEEENTLEGLFVILCTELTQLSFFKGMFVQSMKEANEQEVTANPEENQTK